MRVVEGFRESLGLTQRRQDTPRVARREERQAQGEPEIDGLLARGTRLRQMQKGAERLLEEPHGLAVGRPRQSLLPRLPAVRQGLVPHLPPQGMVGQAFDLLGHPLSGEGFEGLDDPRVQGAPPLLEETAVGHLVGEGVLEGVCALGKSRVSYRNSAAWRWASPRCSVASGSSAMACSRGTAMSLPITEAACRRSLSGVGKRSMRAASTA